MTKNTTENFNTKTRIPATEKLRLVSHEIRSHTTNFKEQFYYKIHVLIYIFTSDFTFNINKIEKP